MTTTSGFDGIDVADQVSDGDVRRCKFLDVAFFRREICDCGGFATLRDQIAAAAANGGIWVVMNLTAGDVGHVRIKQRSEAAENAAFGLSSKTQQYEIMTR